MTRFSEQCQSLFSERSCLDSITLAESELSRETEASSYSQLVAHFPGKCKGFLQQRKDQLGIALGNITRLCQPVESVSHAYLVLKLPVHCQTLLTQSQSPGVFALLAGHISQPAKRPGDICFIAQFSPKRQGFFGKRVGRRRVVPYPGYHC